MQIYICTNIHVHMFYTYMIITCTLRRFSFDESAGGHLFVYTHICTYMFSQMLAYTYKNDMYNIFV